MDCNKADGYLMKYMDGSLSESEAAVLNKHLTECEECRSDFELYDSMLTDFSELELISAPEGLEEAVMAKLNALPDVVYKSESRLDSLIWAVWGAFSVLIGVGFMLSMNKDAVLGYLASKPALTGFVTGLSNASAYVNGVLSDISVPLDAFGTAALGYLTSFKYVLLLIFVILAAIQYIIYKKDKVGA